MRALKAISAGTPPAGAGKRAWARLSPWQAAQPSLGKTGVRVGQHGMWRGEDFRTGCSGFAVMAAQAVGDVARYLDEDFLGRDGR
jgi:hypothetical protein